MFAVGDDDELTLVLHHFDDPPVPPACDQMRPVSPFAQ